MARKQRQFEICQTQHTVTLPVADNADFELLGIIAPEDGAMLRELLITITTAGGAGTATATVQAEVLGGTTVLSSPSATFNVDEPDNTVISLVGPAGGGLGSPVATKGKTIALNFNYDAGTVGTAPVATITAFWQM